MFNVTNIISLRPARHPHRPLGQKILGVNKLWAEECSVYMSWHTQMLQESTFQQINILIQVEESSAKAILLQNVS